MNKKFLVIAAIAIIIGAGVIYFYDDMNKAITKPECDTGILVYAYGFSEDGNAYMSVSFEIIGFMDYNMNKKTPYTIPEIAELNAVIGQKVNVYYYLVDGEKMFRSWELA